MNAINKIEVRANAEGWNALSLKKALDNQIQIDLEAAIKEWKNSFYRNEAVSDEEVVNTLTSEYYGGGYMYPGSEVSPSKFQARYTTSSPPVEGDVEGALEWIKTAPIGEKVNSHYNAGNGKHQEEFQKTPNGWVRTFYVCENDCPNQQSGPWLTAGIRERVAAKIGAPLSPTFHQAFDEAVENLW